MAITRLAFLGDSQSDQDEFWSYSTALVVEPFPPPAFYDRKFTNGQVHAQVLPGLLGLEGGDELNYAVASARAVGPLSVADIVADELASGDFELKDDADLSLLDDRIDLAAQTARLLQDAAADGEDLSELGVVIWIGINDLNNWVPDDLRFWTWRDDLEALVTDIVDTTVTAAEALLAAGTGEVWVATQPEVTFYPGFDVAPGLVQLFSIGLIEQLNDQLVAGIEALGDPRAQILDLNALTDEIEADSSNFRIDIDTPILLSFGSDPNPSLNPALPADFDFATDADDYGFLDLLHPTEALHEIIAVFESEAISSNLIVGGAAADRLAGTADDDLVLSSGGWDRVSLSPGDDVALGGLGRDLLQGDDGSDLISGGGGDDTVAGGSGDDLLTGGEGDDRVRGGSGSDLLVDTSGSDTIRGGTGDDVFLWYESDEPSDADIVDGGPGVDSLTLFLATTASFEAAVAAWMPGAQDQSFEGLSVFDVETISFVDLSVTPDPVLPALSSPDLVARVDEWDLWNFA